MGVEKGKPAARRGRKARGLARDGETAQLPTSINHVGQGGPAVTKYNLYRICAAASAVIAAVIASGAGNKF
jgi:hypothetical protein